MGIANNRDDILNLLSDIFVGIGLERLSYSNKVV